MADLESDGFLATTKDAAETWVLFLTGPSISSSTSPSQLVLLKEYPTASGCLLVPLVSVCDDPWQVVEAQTWDKPAFKR